MTRADMLRQKFEAWYETTAGGSIAQRSDLWLAYLAGANAAMDMHFESGAVRFGPSFTVMQSTDPQPGDTPLTNPFHPHCEYVDIEDFVRLPDLGGES